MKLDIESAVVFAGTEFSTIEVSFAGLTFEQYKAAKSQMIASIIKDLQPDYLNIGAEPDTMASLLGIKELNDPIKYTEYVNYLLKNMDRGSTKIIAGAGTWSNLNIITSLASSTSIDCLAIHIYPVVGECLSNAVKIADIAARNKKGLVLDECWLYKVDKFPTSGVAAATEIFRRDSFSFWSPLDKQFLAEMVKYARLYNVEFISPFWTNLFFGSLDYSKESAGLSYTDIAARTNNIAARNIASDKFSATGESYRRLIQER